MLFYPYFKANKTLNRSDSPNIKSPKWTIRARNASEEEGSYWYDQSDSAQKMMKGEWHSAKFTDISIPFPSSSPIKGAYICVNSDDPSHLIFTFTSLEGEQISKKYEFSKYGGWYFLPVDLPDVVLCEITGKGRKEECFGILSLVFIRKETSEETIAREAKEKLWAEASVVESEFVKGGGRESIPIPRDDPKLVDPSFLMLKCKNDSYSKESKYYDRSSDAQRMLKGESDISLSHLYIPFPSPSPMKGAYICVDKYCSPSLLFTFTDSDGKKTSKKYEFTRPKHEYEWHFLPIDLENVVLCEIEGKGIWWKENSRIFEIYSLMFTMPEETIAAERKGNDKDSAPKDTKQKKRKDKKKHNPKDGKPKYNPKHDSLTLTSVSTLTSQCIIGSGGFGEVLLVKVDGIPFPCVLKKMLRSEDKTVVNDCRKEFKVHLKLFNHPKCFNRIPRPLYILDLLDSDMKGVYGFLMEFCVGGSVSAFAKRWCADGKYVSVVDTADDSEPADVDADFDSDLYLDSCSRPTVESADVDTAVPDFDAMTLNPVKVCSLCVGMIECLDDVFTAKPKLVHRDVKPDNFLVRVDPKNGEYGECTVVLSDLGLVHIQDSISSSMSSKSFVAPSASSSSSSHSTQAHKPKRSICGTLVYNSYEALQGLQSQSSDAYSLGISLLALFLCCDPFLQIPALKWAGSPAEFIKELIILLKSNSCPRIVQAPLFKSLLTIDGGKYEHVHKLLNEVFTGLTMLDVDKRMSVHQARVKVQTIKPLLPKIGEDFDCPSIDDIIREQRKKYGDYVGTIEGGCGLVGVGHGEGWDQSQ
ncbi:hypothetical protein ADUPG1_006118 [Aduncisulcus paluster]|uniref:Protein kinase domain-containing protein n=1 Tax=Aduncisulcus paluster TaxID=2918883 RepID=A0ABQ5KIP5_9EUKA|nr:hypothetical protein ADUPG1_006118 [Aduncisulcus paluster]